MAGITALFMGCDMTNAVPETITVTDTVYIERWSTPDTIGIEFDYYKNDVARFVFHNAGRYVIRNRYDYHDTIVDHISTNKYPEPDTVDVPSPRWVDCIWYDEDSLSHRVVFKYEIKPIADGYKYDIKFGRVE